MIEYRVDLQGRSTPVLMPITKVAFFGAVAVQAFCVGTGSAMYLGLLLSLLTSAAVAMCFLMCRPRYQFYLMPVLSFGIVFLFSFDPFLALLSMDYFLYGFLIALGLRLRWNKLFSVMAVSAAMLVVAFLQYVASIDAFTFAKGWEEFLLSLDSLREYMESLLTVSGELSSVVAEDFGEIFDNTLVPLIPAFLVTFGNLAAYVTVSVAYRLLGIVPMYREVLMKKHLSVSRITAGVYLALWLASLFVPAGNVFSAILLNLVYVLMMPMAVIGFRGFWEIRGRSMGGLRMAFNAALVALAFAVFFMGIGLALGLVGFSVLGAVLSIRKRRWYGGF